MIRTVALGIVVIGVVLVLIVVGAVVLDWARLRLAERESRKNRKAERDADGMWTFPTPQDKKPNNRTKE